MSVFLDNPKIQSFNIYIDGHRVFYYTFGQGPPLILIHGWPTCADMFLPLASELHQRYQLFIPDLPGFGNSQSWGKFSYQLQSRFIKRFAKTLGINRFHLLGVSMGAAISAFFAAANPALVDRLVLVNTPIFLAPESPKKFAILTRLSRLNNFGLSFTVDLIKKSPLVGRFYRSRLNCQGLDPRFYSQLITRSCSNTSQTIIESINQILKTNLFPAISKISSPVMFVVGSADHPEIIKNHYRLQSSHPAIPVCWLPNASHRLAITQYRQLSKVVIKFISGQHS